MRFYYATHETRLQLIRLVTEILEREMEGKKDATEWECGGTMI